MLRADGWYWVFERDDEVVAVMYRIWSPKTGPRRVYRHGHTRLSPRRRDQLVENGAWVEASRPGEPVEEVVRFLLTLPPNVVG